VSTFRDGPARGATLLFRRAPLYLRVVENRHTHAFDVLDQLGDTPADDEIVHVYRRITEPVSAHLHYRGRGKSNASGWYEIADYEHLPEIDGEQLRDTAIWRAWCGQRVAA
jgi:hypothetical protein